MTDNVKAFRLSSGLLMEDLSNQVDALSFLASAVAVGGDELMCLDNGRGLWLALENTIKEMKEIIEKVESLYKDEEVTT